MCKWALISWPIDQPNPSQIYLILGEIYDKKIQNDSVLLSEFYRNLAYLYPFRYSVADNNCYNAEDMVVFRKKYGLTAKCALVGATLKKTLAMRSPILYDISCMVPLFQTKIPRMLYSQKNNGVCIVLLCSDPIDRGKLLQEAIGCGPVLFVLAAATPGSNRDSLVSLGRRYLLVNKVPVNRVLQNSGKLESMLQFFAESPITIVCSSEVIQKISRGIRMWKRATFSEQKITYRCPL